MPVGVVPRQTRDLEPHDDARVSHAHIGDQTLKTFPPCCRRARLALIVVDDDNLVISPAQSDGATTQSVLTFRAFHILHDLPHGGLPDIQIRTSLKMVRLNFKRFHSCNCSGNSGWDCYGCKEVDYGSMFHRRLPVRWSGAGLPLGCTHGGRRSRPAPHAHMEKEHKPGTGFGRQSIAEGGRTQSFVVRSDGRVDRSALWVGHREVFFPATARSIVLGCIGRANLCRTSFANSRARTGWPATSCCWTNASASPCSLWGPCGPRFRGTNPARPPLSKVAFVW